MPARSHGMSSSPEYKTWYTIKRRCYEENFKEYYNYGGRGIAVCKRWLESFENFMQDMGRRPSDNHSIERLDVNGNYCPENCTWIENRFQSRNHRKRKDNTSGVTGVSKTAKNSWLARVCDLLTGERKSKSFSMNKYGEEEAFRLACNWRLEMIRELNKQGAGYSDDHGK